MSVAADGTGGLSLPARGAGANIVCDVAEEASLCAAMFARYTVSRTGHPSAGWKGEATAVLWLGRGAAMAGLACITASGRRGSPAPWQHGGDDSEISRSAVNFCGAEVTASCQTRLQPGPARFASDAAQAAL